ncbi:carph-isopro domain-containing protein [Roseicitreum antarcticum]|uniref:carph-isopro domain-containing protein n=1 Tax=Roseicitreum antarcticum TaxID=564137 RepID=UPI00115F8EE8
MTQRVLTSGSAQFNLCRMNKDKLISIWGSAANLARAIGEGETTVRNWFNRGSIPARYDAKIMSASRGAGTEVTPQDLFDLRQSLLARCEQQKTQQHTGVS